MTTRMPTGMSLAQWAAQMQNAGGGRNKYLSKWKEKGFANTWLHPASSILSLWRHQVPRIFVKEDKQTQVKTVEVYGDSCVCYENEEVLEDMHFREKVPGAVFPQSLGARKNPPKVCPICIMIEHLTQLVVEGRLDWRYPVFEFRGTDPSKNRLLHVGGITGLFNAKVLPPEKLAELAGAESTDPTKAALQRSGSDPWFPATKWGGPIYRKGPTAAFMQDGRPKQEYAVTVIDNDDVGAGIQIAFINKGLGAKILDVIAKAIKEARGPADPEGLRGDPQRNPYVIRWEYNQQAGERDMRLYYDAIRMGGIPLTAPVHALLTQPPPSVAKLAERFNLKVMRARLEEHLSPKMKKLPLDMYFEKAFALEAKEKANAPVPPAEPMVPEVGRNPGSVGYPIPPPPVANGGPTHGYAGDFGPLTSGLQYPSTNDDANPLIACEGCGQPVRMLDPKCAACGKVFVVEAAPPLQPPRLPTRAEILARQQGMVTAPTHLPLPMPSVASPGLPVPFNGGPVLPGEPDPWGLEPGSVGQSDTQIGESDAAWPGDPSTDIPFVRNVSCDAREAWHR